MEKYAAVILAAGKGTRMNEGSASPIPKVMFLLDGKPIIDYSVAVVKDAGIDEVVLVVGYKKELIEEYFGSKVEYAVQEEQLGTGHAAMMAKPILAGRSDSVAIFYGDNPLYSQESVHNLMTLYEKEKPTVAMLSVVFQDPSYWAFGRIIRDGSGEVIGIREQKDCKKEELEIKECNPGFYIFDGEWLWENVEKLSNDNAQKEYYLTDLIAMAKDQNKRIVATPVVDEKEALGINNTGQLAQAEEIIKNRR